MITLYLTGCAASYFLTLQNMRKSDKSWIVYLLAGVFSLYSWVMVLSLFLIKRVNPNNY